MFDYIYIGSVFYYTWYSFKCVYGGVERNIWQARRLYELAVEQGHSEVKKRLKAL